MDSNPNAHLIPNQLVASDEGYTLAGKGNAKVPLLWSLSDQSTVTLDESRSMDPDGDPLTFTWSFSFQPGSADTLIVSNVEPPILAPDFPVRVAISDDVQPTAAITSPADNSILTEPIDIIGTANESNFLKYVLEIAPVGETTFSKLSEGTSPVINGVLGKCDPTLLLNDLYKVRLTVFDGRGKGTQTSVSVTYQVARDQKIGIFTLAFQDLNIPLDGLPITINRVYDSRAKSQGHFGIGWSLDIQTLKARSPVREFGNDQKVDQKDPTPHLHVAQLNENSNRIKNAVRDLVRSLEQNDNRMLYRSRLLLDQDRAVRRANLAKMYDAGREGFALRQATGAVTADYDNAAAHLFIANSFNKLRDSGLASSRYETPWLNEFLLANLLAPVTTRVLSSTNLPALFPGIDSYFLSLIPEEHCGKWSVGICLNVPCLGPLHFDYDIPITDAENVTGCGKFQFSVGFTRDY